LGRAFLEAGAKVVILSLWKVADAATLELVTHFYSHLLRDDPRPNPAEALQRAMIDTRSDLAAGRITEPSGKALSASAEYWAPFIVLGDGFGTVPGEPFLANIQ
jgi:CHAT domain-containing protein